jgi:hypothetical protein
MESMESTGSHGNPMDSMGLQCIRVMDSSGFHADVCGTVKPSNRPRSSDTHFCDGFLLCPSQADESCNHAEKCEESASDTGGYLERRFECVDKDHIGSCLRVG